MKNKVSDPNALLNSFSMFLNWNARTGRWPAEPGARSAARRSWT